jgi:hypothetical protein
LEKILNFSAAASNIEIFKSTTKAQERDALNHGKEITYYKLKFPDCELNV